MILININIIDSIGIMIFIMIIADYMQVRHQQQREHVEDRAGTVGGTPTPGGYKMMTQRQ